MKHGANPSSPHVLSLKISWPLHSLMKLIMMKKFLIQFMLLLGLFHSNASSFNEEANMEEQSFYVSLEDTDDEK